jgi:hypothetical protein
MPWLVFSNIVTLVTLIAVYYRLRKGRRSQSNLLADLIAAKAEVGTWREIAIANNSAPAFGRAELKAIETKVPLTADIVAATFVIATIMGMENTVANDLDNATKEILEETANLSSSLPIEEKRKKLLAIEAKKMEIARYRDLLPR